MVAAALLLGACDSSKEEDRGDLVNVWKAAPDTLSDTLALLDEQRLFEEAVAQLNARFRLPRDVSVVHQACGDANSFYSSGDHTISLCYELLAAIDAEVRSRPPLSDEDIARRIRAAWLFIFFHELGHALIHLYDIPVTGKEEDSVDNFSTFLLLHVDGADVAALAAEYWGASDAHVYGELAYADEHPLSAQRFYWILCMVYGSDPDNQQHILDEGLLTEERASRCPGEYAQMHRSWERVLDPWLR